MGDDQHQYPQIVRAILARPWAIDPDSLAWAAIMEVVALRSAGQAFNEAEIRSRLAAANNGPRNGGGRARNVAVIPIYGVISQRQSLMAQTSGGTSAQQITNDFRSALADPEVDGIVFDVDSPGGVVEGIDELAAEIQAARGQKPMAAVAQHAALSAAYWAIAGVDEIVSTPSGMVGSIGVFTGHDDLTDAMGKVGVKRTVISAGKYKAEGALGMPLSEEAIAAVQEQVDTFYGMFTSRVSRGRGVPVDSVRNGFGQGRGVLAKKALDLGMVDRIDSLENTIRRVARGTVGAKPKAAAISSTRADGSPDDDSPTGLEAGLSFADALSAVTAQATAITAEAAKRAALRAEEGRDLSDATRTGLLELAGSLTAIAQAREPVKRPNRVAALRLARAAAEFDFQLAGDPNG
jgi:signal peptide peptidase SppA